jgi:bifunctional N-acetylglucosamine-1-phosphate-uridyltransferase/glucosamine-1-phosphate-acetyltransferase GlmU-like protein
MGPWTGVVTPLPGPGADGLNSSLPAHLHPVAGRPLVWHTAWSLASLSPAPQRVIVAVGADGDAERFADIPVPVEVIDGEVPEIDGWTLAVHSAAPCSGPALQRILDRGQPAALDDERGRPVARFRRGGSPAPAPHHDADAFGVRSRAELARASATIRDRLVRALMEEGVTFLLPHSVIIDVDVTIGRDAVIYPGVVLEGHTTVGGETVIGPCCRVVSSRIGSGAELKGFNYLANTTLRNHAILEPHVRRGFD